MEISKVLIFAGDGDNFFFIHAYQGPQHRHSAHRVGAGDGLHRLAGHLAQAFTGNQSRATGLPGHPVAPGASSYGA